MKRLVAAAFAVGACAPAASPPAVAKSPPPAPDRAAPVEAAATAVARGEAVELAGGGGVFAVELAHADGAAYTLVVSSARLAASDRTFAYRASTTPSGPRVRAAAKVVPPCARGAAPRADGPAPPALAPPPAKKGAKPIAVGATRTFKLRGHGRTHAVPAKAVAVGTSSVVWGDVSPEHGAVLDPAFVTDFQRDFDEIILPRARAVFGAESDVDGDGKIALLFTPLTRGAAVAFFSGCDLAGARCPDSNDGELLYLTPPNAIAPPYNTARAMKEILAHELEHLIHQNRKVLRNGLAEDPDGAYLLEGFGALAQDVLGYQAGNLYVTHAGLERIGELSLGDVLSPSAGYDPERDGGLRGGAYLFVRWLYDRAGGDAIDASGAIADRGGPALVKRLLDAPRSVAEELTAALGASHEDLAIDFFTALALPEPSRDVSNGGAAAGLECLRFRATSVDAVTKRQRGADPFASFHGMRMEGPRVVPLERADGRLRGGGVEYLAIEADRARPVIRFEIDPAAEPRVRVVRTR